MPPRRAILAIAAFLAAVMILFPTWDYTAEKYGIRSERPIVGWHPMWSHPRPPDSLLKTLDHNFVESHPDYKLMGCQLALLAFVTLYALGVVAHKRLQQEMKLLVNKGCSARCGCDLRASPARCPECGRVQ